MRLSGGKRKLELALPVCLLALLLVLGALQYRWTGAVSRAEAERLRSSLEASLARFSNDLEEELARAARSLSARRSEELGEALADFRQRANHPDLVDEVYRVSLEGGALALARVAEDGTLEPDRRPFPGLERFLDRLPDGRHRHAAARHRGPRWLVVVRSDPLTLFVPRAGLRDAAALLVVFRNDVIAAELLPELARRHFGEEGSLAFDVVVLDDSDRVLFSTRPDFRSVVEEPDAAAGLLSLHGPLGSSRPARAGDPPPRAEPGGRWTVLARHHSGSLEAVVSRARSRNLALGSGVLLVLAVSIVLMAVSARRAMELGERRMEFVAGVSHELRTPLAVIRSAAQNLKDGSVSGAEQVKRYGGLIEAEGQRLGDLVERVLELAGAQSQARVALRERLPASRIARAAIEDCAAAARERGVAVETRFSTEDPEVLGDEDALRRGVANLVANAVKHGNGDGSIAVSVEGRNGEVVISVSDRGPGIPRSELPHVFDAFYRGSRAREQQVPGSGLGLSLVRQVAADHGGRVEAESSPGRGSRFSLILPRAPRTS